MLNGTELLPRGRGGRACGRAPVRPRHVAARERGAGSGSGRLTLHTLSTSIYVKYILDLGTFVVQYDVRGPAGLRRSRIASSRLTLLAPARRTNIDVRGCVTYLTTGPSRPVVALPDHPVKSNVGRVSPSGMMTWTPNLAATWPARVPKPLRVGTMHAT